MLFRLSNLINIGSIGAIIMKKAVSHTLLITVLFIGFVLADSMQVSVATSNESTELAPIPKPSVPEFNVEFGVSSYDMPTTYSIDPFTGEKITHHGYHVESKTIELKIKNQPFVPYHDDSRGWNIRFYYNIRIKGHYSEDWIELYRASDGYPIPSDSQYTIFSYVLGENTDTILGTKKIEFPAGAQVDFQVEAMIGFVHRVVTGSTAPWIFTGEKSGWSETKTLIFPTSEQTEIPEFPSWFILPFILMGSSVVMLCRKQLKRTR